MALIPPVPRDRRRRKSESASLKPDSPYMTKSFEICSRRNSFGLPCPVICKREESWNTACQGGFTHSPEGIRNIRSVPYWCDQHDGMTGLEPASGLSTNLRGMTIQRANRTDRAYQNSREVAEHFCTGGKRGVPLLFPLQLFHTPYSQAKSTVHTAPTTLRIHSHAPSNITTVLGKKPAQASAAYNWQRPTCSAWAVYHVPCPPVGRMSSLRSTWSPRWTLACPPQDFQEALNGLVLGASKYLCSIPAPVIKPPIHQSTPPFRRCNVETLLILSLKFHSHGIGSFAQMQGVAVYVSLRLLTTGQNVNIFSPAMHVKLLGYISSPRRPR